MAKASTNALKKAKKAKRAFLTAGEAGLSPTSSSCPQVGFTDPKITQLDLHNYRIRVTWILRIKLQTRHTFEGMSNLWGYDLQMKLGMSIFDGMSYLWWYVIPLMVCHTYVCTYVKPLILCQTCKGMSCLWRDNFKPQPNLRKSSHPTLWSQYVILLSKKLSS